MAIGSAPEIGVEFGNLTDWDPEAWHQIVGGDLLGGGYARLLFPPRTPATNRHLAGNPEESKP